MDNYSVTDEIQRVFAKGTLEQTTHAFNQIANDEQAEWYGKLMLLEKQDDMVFDDKNEYYATFETLDDVGSLSAQGNGNYFEHLAMLGKLDFADVFVILKQAKK